MAKRPVVEVVISAVDKATKQIKGIQRAIGGLKNAIGGIATGVVAGMGVAALGSFFKSAIDKAGEAERSWVSASGALSRLGINADRVRPQVDALVKSLSRISGRDDDD